MWLVFNFTISIHVDIGKKFTQVFSKFDLVDHVQPFEFSCTGGRRIKEKWAQSIVY